MKAEFEKKDIKQGMYVIKNTFVETGSNYIEALDSIRKIGYLFPPDKAKDYCMISMKDGYVYIYRDMQKLLEDLKKEGFIPIETLIAMKYLTKAEIEGWGK